MSNENSNSSSAGIGFVGALTIAFIVLKLLKIIDWSWWWILSPIWITIFLMIGIFIIILAIIVIVGTYK